MRLRESLSAIALLSAFIGVARAVSCGNVTIANQTDADEVRKDCSVISGTLTLAHELAETLNLDGIETIEGSLVHEGCDTLTDECTTPSAFSISSSTLTTINGDIDVWWFNGLKELRFPNLTLVQNAVSLKRMHELELLDFTSLARVGYIIIEAANLTDLRHEKLEAFTAEGSPGYVAFWAAAVDSIDSFLSTPMLNNTSSELLSFSMQSYSLPNVRHVTLGWSNLETVDISANDLGITLGAANTTSMNITTLKIDGNITSFDRGSALKNLTVGEFSLEDSRTDTQLDVPFDQLSSLTVQYNDVLQNITLPPEAVDWKDFALSIRSCPNLTLASEYQTAEDGSRNQTWYWPQENMQSISIVDVATSDDFFGTFLANANSSNPVKVLENFEVVPNDKLTFSCTPFNELHDRGILPASYSCQNVTSDSVSALTVHKSAVVGMAILAMAASIV